MRLVCKEHNEWTGNESYTDPQDNTTKTRYVTFIGNNEILNLETMLFGTGRFFQ